MRELMTGETELAYPALLEPRAGRPPLVSPERFVAWVEERQRPEGYRLLGGFAEGVATAMAVAGFRRLHTLAWGDLLYVDDLVTLPDYRERGYADALVAWLEEEARRLGCAQVRLDSGTRRHSAHRFYLTTA